MKMMRLPGVWTTNTAALLLGFGMYSAFILIPQFVQTPTSTGYGFGASVTQAGLFLAPVDDGDADREPARRAGSRASSARRCRSCSARR